MRISCILSKILFIALWLLTINSYCQIDSAISQRNFNVGIFLSGGGKPYFINPGLSVKIWNFNLDAKYNKNWYGGAVAFEAGKLYLNRKSGTYVCPYIEGEVQFNTLKNHDYYSQFDYARHSILKLGARLWITNRFLLQLSLGHLWEYLIYVEGYRAPYTSHIYKHNYAYFEIKQSIYLFGNKKSRLFVKLFK